MSYNNQSKLYKFYICKNILRCNLLFSCCTLLFGELMLGKITPEFIYSFAISFIYTLHMLVEFHLLTSLFSFLHNYSFSFIYLQNIFPPDYIPTIPPLIRRGVSKSEHVFEYFKFFSSKRFCEDCLQLDHLWNNVKDGMSWTLHHVESNDTLC